MSKAKTPAAAPAKSNLGDELDKAAHAIAQEIQLPDTILEEKIAGFKALTAYWAMINKLPPPPDDTKARFGGFADTVKTHRSGAKLNDF